MNFTPKSEDQLAWDLIKIMVRGKVGVEVAEYRNRRVNDLLGEIWPAFRASLNGETALEIDPQFETWIADALGAVEAGREAAGV